MSKGRPLTWWSILNASFSVLSPHRSHKQHLCSMPHSCYSVLCAASEIKMHPLFCMQTIGIQHNPSLSLLQLTAQKHTFFVWSLYWWSVRENVTLLWVSQAKTTDWINFHDVRLWLLLTFFILCPSKIPSNC